MAANQPEIAVVIATRGRESRLAFALEALAGQLDPGCFEVIVVRDEDAPGPFAAAPPGLPVRFLTRPGTEDGPTGKRNFGWREARAPLVAFTDDDCRAAPDWLARLLAAADGQEVFLQGRTAPDPQEAHLLHGFARTIEVPEATGWYETCNIAYPRALLERLEGFDEDLGFNGEDTDLAYRAIAAGAEPRFVPEAVVHHAVTPRTLRQAFADARRWRGGSTVILARYPATRDSLFAGHFWNREHMAISVALVGLAFGRRAPALAAMLALPYLDMRVNWREPRPRTMLRALAMAPVHAALDATEVVVRLPSAVRHRVAVI